MTTPPPLGSDGFPARLAALLEKKNQGNQSLAARELGCTPQAVNRWLAGISLPRGNMLDKLAVYLGTTPAYLKFGDGASGVTAKYMLDWIDMDGEAWLLHRYRSASKRGKAQLLTMADHVENDENLPKKP